MHALGRIGGPDDVARALEFLLHPENSFITGQIPFRSRSPNPRYPNYSSSVVAAALKLWLHPDRSLVMIADQHHSKRPLPVMPHSLPCAPCKL
jgi:hypothetical protein